MTTLSIRPRVTQNQKPSGWLGRLVLRNMNARHSGVTDWGLSHVRVEKDFTILDAGCGGGRTVGKLAAMASDGKVYGVDYSAASVAVATKTNQESIRNGRVEIREGNVVALPFQDDTFDLVTAVETHFWWPDLPAGFREVFRVLRPGGRVAVIAEIYKGAQSKMTTMVEKYAPKTGIQVLTADEHAQLLSDAGFIDVQVATEPHKGWIFAGGRKRL
ncbi:MAG TPA: class I SAM-dependent methyltransferase [Acidobacteriaceae bacterium]|nr:class I SAM-dependent methyltransferase [Acidobacteriaceae bacterium]